MNNTLKTKLLQHLATNKKSNKGFTLVELLVVVIIVGILAAIALPNMLNQAARAKESEARQKISSVNRAQAAHRTVNPEFAGTFDELALGDLTGDAEDATANYAYEITPPEDGEDQALMTATPVDEATRGFEGGIARYVNGANNPVTSDGICEANTPGSTNTPDYTVPDVDNPRGQCENGTIIGAAEEEAGEE